MTFVNCFEFFMFHGSDGSSRRLRVIYAHKVTGNLHALGSPDPDQDY